MKIKPPFTLKVEGAAWIYLRNQQDVVCQYIPFHRLQFPLIDTTKTRKAIDSKIDSRDCTVRAFASATSTSYLSAHHLAKMAGRAFHKGFWSARILKKAKEEGLLDFTESFMYDKKKAAKFGYGYHSSYYPTLLQVMPLLMKGRYILETHSHAFAVVDGVIYDQGSKLKVRARIKTIFEVKI